MAIEETKVRTLGMLRLATEQDNGNLSLVDTGEDFSTMKDVAAYLKRQAPEKRQEYLVVRLVSKAVLEPETRMTLSMEPIS